MKKKLLVFTAIITFAFTSKGQFPYASIWSGYPVAYELSAGFATKNTPGYFWLGYLSTVVNVPGSWHVNKNFCIMGTGQSAIWAAYKVYDANQCNGSLSQVLNGYGVSAIETQGPNGLGYAIAGSYDKGCYFTTIDVTGNVLSSMLYPFPSPPSGDFPEPSKPIIVESPRGNYYYICGSYEGDMYVLKVDVTGAIIWSGFYKVSAGVDPRDMIINPYTAGHVAIVGKTIVSNSDHKGFFMDLDGSNGNVVTTRLFGNPSRRDAFNTICLGSNMSNGNRDGFVIGGYNEPTIFNFATAWVIKLDPSGNPIWSNDIKTAIGLNKGVIDILERQNTFGNYEYYALLQSTSGMQVLKLDERGDPFPISQPFAPANEFVYDLPSLIPSKATSLSYVNGPATSPDVGIQVFGTAYNFTGFSSSYVVSAYFNGETNCFRTLTTINQARNGPTAFIPVPTIRYGSIESCSNFLVSAFFPGGALNYPCAGLMTTGSNLRPMAPGGVNAPAEETGENFEVFPNPVTDKATVNYSASDNSKVTIEVYNLLGQRVAIAEPAKKQAGTYQEEIDFYALNLQSGAYFVVTTVDGQSHKQKVLYSN